MLTRRFTYAGSLDNQSIRLLRIASTQGQPTTDDGRTSHEVVEHHGILCLELEQFDIGSEPPYRALSYTWGPPEEKGADDNEDARETYVLINGESHDVTENLLNAILHFRASSPDDVATPYVWIDALCINQEDLEERRVHVAIMDSIFQNAEEVIVWLGLANPHTAETFRLVEKVAALDESFYEAFGDGESPDRLTNYGLPGDGDELWRHYMDMYDRRWFHRGWVIQEVVMAQRVIVHWGPHTMPWETLIAGCRIFLPERLRKFFFSQFRGSDLKHIHNLPLGRNAWRIGLIQEACLQRNFESLLIVDMCTGEGGFAAGEHVLLHLMRMARDFAWTDPRDRVYSLLGLVNFTARLHGVRPLRLMPDYSKLNTPAATLTDVASAIIERSGSLGIISQVSDVVFRQVEGLPSWVPNFVRSPNLAQGRETLFQAYGDRHGLKEPLYDIEGSTLFVKGRQIGVITESLDLDHGGRIDNLVGLIDMAYRSRLPLQEDRADVLWRTMIWDIYGHSVPKDEHPAPASLADSFIDLVRSIASSHSNGTQEGVPLSSTLVDMNNHSAANGSSTTTAKLSRALSGASTKVAPGAAAHSSDNCAAETSSINGSEAFASHASGVTWAQHLFLLDTGYLAMGPQSSKAGDEVWVVAGCLFPMVLRRVDNGSHFVMGRVYVHGAMHGEAVMDDGPWEELRLE